MSSALHFLGGSWLGFVGAGFPVCATGWVGGITAWPDDGQKAHKLARESIIGILRAQEPLYRGPWRDGQRFIRCSLTERFQMPNVSRPTGGKPAEPPLR